MQQSQQKTKPNNHYLDVRNMVDQKAQARNEYIKRHILETSSSHEEWSRRIEGLADELAL